MATELMQTGDYLIHKRLGFVYKVMMGGSGGLLYCRYEGKGARSPSRFASKWAPVLLTEDVLRPMTEQERTLWDEACKGGRDG